MGGEKKNRKNKYYHEGNQLIDIDNRHTHTHGHRHRHRHRQRHRQSRNTDIDLDLDYYKTEGRLALLFIPKYTYKQRVNTSDLKKI